MNIFKKFVNHIKGSQLVEKVLMVAFSVAVGAGTIVYMTNVIKTAKNQGIDVPEVYNNQGIGFIQGRRYTVLENPSLDIDSLAPEDMEFVSVSHCYNPDGTERLLRGQPYQGFIGYSSYGYDNETGEIRTFSPRSVEPYMLYYFTFDRQTREAVGFPTQYDSDETPRLNETGFDDAFYSGLSFEFSGRWVRQGNGPHLIDHLTFYEE